MADIILSFFVAFQFGGSCLKEEGVTLALVTHCSILFHDWLPVEEVAVQPALKVPSPTSHRGHVENVAFVSRCPKQETTLRGGRVAAR